MRLSQFDSWHRRLRRYTGGPEKNCYRNGFFFFLLLQPPFVCLVSRIYFRCADPLRWTAHAVAAGYWVFGWLRGSITFEPVMFFVEEMGVFIAGVKWGGGEGR